MKKRILMLLMAIMMLLGMSMISYADEARYYEGIANYDEYYQGTGDGFEEDISVIAVRVNDRVSGKFVTSKGDTIEWWAEINDGQMTGNGYVLINNIYETDGFGGWAYIDENDKIFLYTKNGYPDSIGEALFDYHLVLTLEPSNEPVTHQISAPFTGVAESDTGSYTLALAGYYTAKLTDGTHVLSASDITAQTIAIVAYNKANGVKRVMRETTIEEMTVTVSGGTVTEYTIRGRVQTDGGTLDRYTATINP